MSSIINTNILGINAHRNLKISGEKNALASAKLSSGLRVNSAADDAAGLAISSGMAAQIRGLKQAERNVGDGISLIQTAEGGMSEVSSILLRQRELIIQALNDTYTDDDRDKMQIEISQLSKEIDALANNTQFNNIPLLNIPPGNSIIPGKSIDLVIPPTTQITVGSITVAEGESFSVWIDNFTHVSGADFPDLVIIDPNGNRFGWGGQHLNSSGHVTTTNADSCEFAEYNGYTDQYERFDFTNVTSAGAGVWHIIIDNSGGDVDSGFTLNSDKEITPEFSSDDVEIENNISIQLGSNSGNIMRLERFDCRTNALGIDPLLVNPRSLAELALMKIDNAVDILNNYRATSGSQQNRLEFVTHCLTLFTINLESSNSRIVDVDMAKAVMDLSKENAKTQSATLMLAQANQQPQKVVDLLS